MVKEEKSALSLSFPVMGGGLADFAKLLGFFPSLSLRKQEEERHRTQASPPQKTFSFSGGII